MLLTAGVRGIRQSITSLPSRLALSVPAHSVVRFISVQDQVDTESPMGRGMFTIIGAMAELESSLISERVTAGMRAAEARGKHLGRPSTPQHIVSEIVALATSTDLSIRQIQAKIADRASRSMVGEITKRARVAEPAPGSGRGPGCPGPPRADPGVRLPRTGLLPKVQRD